MSEWQTAAWPTPHLLNLPWEILQEILGYVPPNDLCRVLRVCKKLHGHGASALYRKVHYTFKTDDDKSGRADIDRFMHLLETLTECGWYSYSGCIKELSFDSMETGQFSPLPGLRYQSSYAYAKLLNMILRGLLMESDELESFRWNAQIEITQSLLYSLSRLENLQHLHIRLQSGSLREPLKKMKTLHPAAGSMYAGPVLYDSIEGTTSVPVPQYYDVSGQQQQHPHSNKPGMPHYHVYNNQSHHNFPPAASSGVKHPTAGSLVKDLTTLGTPQPFGEKPTFSLFSGLRSLAVLEIDTLEYASEIATCVSSCASSLKSLKLSFSAALALKARKKVHALVADTESAWDIDDFDDLPPIPPPPPAGWNNPGISNDTAAAPTSNDAEVRLERAAQEATLARILGAHKSSAHLYEDRGLDTALAVADEELNAITQQALSDYSDDNFVQTLRKIARDVPTVQLTTHKRLARILSKLEKAADRYLEQKGTVVATTDAEASSSWGEVIATDGATQSNPKSKFSLGVSEKSTSTAAAKRSYGDSVQRSEDKITADIDMEHPDHFEESGDDQEFLEDVKEASISANAGVREVHGGGASSGPPGPCADTVAKAQPAYCSVDKGKRPVRDGTHWEQFKEKPERDSAHQFLEDYLRNNHGLPLQSLSLRLIPAKASTLYKAVDFTTLRHLSLVNVGRQRSLWTMLWKLRQISTMQLTAIHTDNVTPEFLEFVTGLPRVTELFLFESNRRAKVESLAPKTTVKIEDIKLKIIDKHIKHLRRLVIRNDEDASWNLDPATVASLTSGGENLIELCAGVNSRVFHLLMQLIRGLRNLFALQLIYHSPDGRCPLLIREMRSSIADIVVHCSDLRLEYIGMCGFLDAPSGNPITRLIKTRDVSRDNGRVESGRNSVKVSVAAGLKLWQVSDVKMWETEMWMSWL